MLKLLGCVAFMCGCYLADAQAAVPKNCVEVAVRVNPKSPSCGTIIKVVREDKVSKVYILSSGHISERNEPEVEIFYSAGKRLKTPIKAKGHVLMLVENNEKSGVDFSLIVIEVGERKIPCLPIAPDDYDMKWAKPYHSVGCDKGVEPKLFSVKPKEPAKKHTRLDFTAEGESSGGRSGGGLFTPDHRYLVGGHWGGMEGDCLITSHKAIRKLLSAGAVYYTHMTMPTNARL